MEAQFSGEHLLGKDKALDSIPSTVKPKTKSLPFCLSQLIVS
jgi:hypothetical protein